MPPPTSAALRASPSSSPLTAWLDRPPPDRGIRFARAEDGWDEWSYERLAAKARRAAAGLAAAGVRRGDVVAIVARSSPAFVASLFGAMLAGATPCPIAPPLAFQPADAYAEHLGGLLASAAPALVVAGGDVAAGVEPVAAASGVELTVPFEALVAAADGEPARRPAAEVALLQFTSGTSGRARGVRVPVGALAANVAAIRDWLRMTPGDVTASWLPVHHDMGLIGCLLTPVVNGGALWLMPPEAFVRDPLRYLRCFDAGGASLSAMPGFGLGYVARRVDPAALDGLDLRAWRAVIVGAERLDAATLERFAALLAPAGLSRRALLPAYGLAEATLAATGLPLEDHWKVMSVDPGRVALGRPVSASAGAVPPVVGCGRPLAGVSVDVVDAAGAPLPAGCVGEIVVRGASVAAGYAGGVDGASATAIEAGAVRTGDAGFLSDGELFVLGRLGDSLKVRGRHVFAEDLEAALRAAGIPSHRVAAILGHRGDQPSAVAILEQPAPAWPAIAASLLRRRVEAGRIVVVDAPRGAIPRTSSGKPKRRRLWADFLDDRLPGTVLIDRPADHGERSADV